MSVLHVSADEDSISRPPRPVVIARTTRLALLIAVFPMLPERRRAARQTEVNDALTLRQLELELVKRGATAPQRAE